MVSAQNTIDLSWLLEVHKGGQPLPEQTVEVCRSGKVQVIYIDAQIQASKAVRLVEVVVAWKFG